MLTPDQAPPKDYYQNNCRSGFDFVLTHYNDLLDPLSRRQLQGFLAASNDAQRLFARLLTRKPLIRTDDLKYTEVERTDLALQELTSLGLIDLSPNKPGDQLMTLLRKAELFDLETSAGYERAKSTTKSQLELLWLCRYSDPQIAKQVRQTCDWLSIAQPGVWRLVRLLYFGDSQQDWSAFVIRDLGMVHYEQVQMSQRRHSSASALKDDLEMQRFSSLSHRLDEHPQLAKSIATLLEQPNPDLHINARRARTLLRLGQWFERQADVENAVSVYALAGRHPARERIVRVLHKHDRTEEALNWLQHIAQAPLNDEEAQFAQRFGKRQAGYQPPTSIIEIDSARPDIEQQALDLVLAEHATSDAWGAHVENSLLRTMTGLIYWPIIFADVSGAFTNPFQMGPNDLYDEDFVVVRHNLLTELEQTLSGDKELTAHLLAVSHAKQGIANSLVSWSLLEQVPITDILEAMPVSDIRVLCAYLIRNLAQRRSGLPDLFMAYGHGSYEFIEVKGPSDQLQPGQRVWFKMFHALNIPARILKLKLKPKPKISEAT